MNFRLTGIYLLPILLLMIIFSCQLRNTDCQSIKRGIFFAKFQGSEWYKTIGLDSLQQEINLKTGDTSLWKVKWLSDCKYSLQYISGIKMESKEMEQFYRSARFDVTIKTVKPDYYVFSAVATASKQRMAYTDTAWRKLPQSR